MASSTTDIANRALTKIGEARILSMSDDTVAGRTMRSIFEQVRDAELRRIRWNFSMRRARLSALAVAPDWGYAYQYQLPDGFMSLVQVGEYYIRPATKAKGPWQVESTDAGSAILTDMPAPLLIRYVTRVTNSGLFDPLFVEALACRLAFEACEAITQSNTKKETLSQEYKNAISEAARCNAIENPPNEIPYGTWLEAREGVFGGGTLGGYDLYGSSTVVL